MANLELRDSTFAELTAFVALAERIGAKLVTVGTRKGAGMSGDGDYISVTLYVPEDKVAGLTAAATVAGLVERGNKRERD